MRYQSILRIVGATTENQILCLIVAGSRKRTISLTVGEAITTALREKSGRAFHVCTDRHIDAVSLDTQIISMIEV